MESSKDHQSSNDRAGIPRKISEKSLAERLRTPPEGDPRELRGHQARTIEHKIPEAFERGDNRLLMKKPTGAGKTREIGEILGRLMKSALVLVPRKNLVDDTIRELMRVGYKKDQLLRKKMTPDKVKKLAKGGVAVLTYQYLLSLYERDRALFAELVKAISIVIADEAHRSLGKKTQEVFRYFDADVGPPPNVPQAEVRAEIGEALTSDAVGRETDKQSSSYPAVEAVLHYTATPRLLDKTVHAVHGLEIVDWVTVGELCKEGTLILPTAINIGTAVASVGGDFRLTGTALDELVELNSFSISGKPVSEVVTDAYVREKERLNGLLPGVVFCSTVKQAQAYVDYVTERGMRAIRVTSATKDFDSGTSPAEAKRMLESDEVDLVVTVTKVGEGWDVPTLRCALWLCTTESPAKDLQGNGRIMRAFPGKDRNNTLLIQPRWIIHRRRDGEVEGGNTGTSSVHEGAVATGGVEVYDSGGFYYWLNQFDEISEEDLTGMGIAIPKLKAPQSDESGFFILEGIRYARKKTWAKELDAPFPFVCDILRGKIGISGKNSSGRTIPFEFFPESMVRELYEEEMKKYPMADEKEFFTLEGVRYGTRRAWANELEVSYASITVLLKKETGINGRNASGEIRYAAYFPEPLVQELMEGRKVKEPIADRCGLLMINGEPHDTLTGISRTIDVQSMLVKARVKDSGTQPVEGRRATLQPEEYYSVAAVKSLCCDLIPVKLDRGRYTENEKEYITINALEDELAIPSRMIRQNIGSLSGKIERYTVIIGTSKIPRRIKIELFPMEEAKNACSELSQLVFLKPDGTCTVDGETAGTKEHWADVLRCTLSELIMALGSAQNCPPPYSRSGNMVTVPYFKESVAREALSIHEGKKANRRRQ